jgi:DNA-binding beta-propeller fold protein YncE
MLVCSVVFTGSALAKDYLFYLGYGQVDVIDTDSDEVVKSILAKGWLREYAQTPDSKQIIITGSRHLVHVIDTDTLAITTSYDMNDNEWEYSVYGIVAAQDNKTFYAHMRPRKTENGEAVIGTPFVAQVDIASGKILRKVDVPFGVGMLMRVKGDKELYAFGLDLYKIDVSGDEMVFKGVEYEIVDKGKNCLALWNYSYANDGHVVAPYYTAEGFGVIEVDPNGKVSDRMSSGVPLIYSVMYSADRSKIFGNMDEVYKLDTKSLDVEAVVEIHQGTNFTMNISSDGKKLYSAAGGPNISVFDAENFKLLKVIDVHTDGWALGQIRK